MRLEATVLQPLRSALGRGEVEAAASGLHRRSASTFEGIHEVERLADILESPAAVVADAARLAAIVPFLERHTRFDTSGSINGYRVQRARLALGPVALGLFCLRDALDMPRLAVAAEARALRRRRDLPGEPWIEPDWWSAERVARLLRRANLLGAALEPLPGDERTVADNLRAIWRVPHVGTERRADPSERVVSGRAAAPGRAAGLARLGTGGRTPDDLEGSILIAPSLESADAPLLWRAAGIVSTGGGILSHLGLIAVESGKPAMILDASWGRLANDEPVLSLRRQLHDERRYERDGWQIVQHHNIRYVDDHVREGDLVIVDADDESFAVLGQDPVTLAFQEALRQHARALARLEDDTPESTLVNRGHLLRARHQLERAASRVANPALARYGVREILLGAAALAGAQHMDEAMPLLRVLLEDPRTGQAARDEVRDVTHALAGQVREARRLATVQLPSACTSHDALALRLNVLRPHRLLRCIASGLDRAGLDADVVSAGDQDDLDAMVVGRLTGIRDRLIASLSDGGSPGGWSARLEQARSIDDLLDIHTADRPLIDGGRAAQRTGASALLRSLGQAFAVGPDAGGVDLEPVAGSKAANLAEASRIIGAGHVPGWFALTDEALRAALDSVVESAAPGGGRFALHEGIEQVLARSDLTIADRAAEIRDLWVRTRLNDPLADAIRRHYAGLGDSVAVAVRSSVFGEDSADVSLAGLFDTYLFVQGERDVMQHVKLAWAGFWNERALHHRLVRRDSGSPRGGLVVQRMVRSRVSGVVQTINAAESRPGEIVINVGLGLGEGIVSGRVAADHVVVAKDGSIETLRFRYLTADKRRRVILDERFGRGTVMVETLAHQRLRPALEYPELCAIVEMSVRLEQAYAQPVDLEFAFEDAEFHLLQVRPVPGASAVWAATAAAFPLRQHRPPQEDRL
jgi:pyruvate,water dikinase